MHFTRASLRNADYRGRKKKDGRVLLHQPRQANSLVPFLHLLLASSLSFFLIWPSLTLSHSIPLSERLHSSSKKFRPTVHKCFWWSWVRICVGGWAVTRPPDPVNTIYYPADVIIAEIQSPRKPRCGAMISDMHKHLVACYRTEFITVSFYLTRQDS